MNGREVLIGGRVVRLSGDVPKLRSIGAVVREAVKKLPLAEGRPNSVGVLVVKRLDYVWARAKVRLFSGGTLVEEGWAYVRWLEKGGAR